MNRLQNKWMLWIGLVILSLASCTPKSTEKKKSSDLAFSRQWLNPLVINEAFENDLTFPIWFDDSLVRSAGIQKITQRIYGSFDEKVVDSSLIHKTFPVEKREFYFDPNGLVDRLVIYSFYDDREVARISYVFQGNMDKNGYRKAVRLQHYQIAREDEVIYFPDYNDRSHTYRVYEPVSWNYKKQSYQEQNTKNKIHVFRNSKQWNVLSVDSIAKPASTDWIIWGNPKKPHKRYHVQNTVLESEVYRYQYWPSGLLKNRTITDYHFKNQRTFQFDESARWIGYIDSTFSNEIYIQHTFHRFQLDQQKRPNEIRHYRNVQNKDVLLYLETFRYHTELPIFNEK